MAKAACSPLQFDQKRDRIFTCYILIKGCSFPGRGNDVLDTVIVILAKKLVLSYIPMLIHRDKYIQAHKL